MDEIKERHSILKQIENLRNSKAILYVTGDRKGLDAQIGQDAVDLFVDHLDALGPVNKLTLILYTLGGSTSAAWNLVNLLQIFCEELEIIIPRKCMSAGTLISLGAKQIVMTKQATLGPIDPSLYHPLGPQIPGVNPEARAHVSVEAVYGYLDALKAYVSDEESRSKVFIDLSDKVHPLLLGEIFRSRQQIRDLAGRLLKKQNYSAGVIGKITDFLCSDSGSHDYTINRREAEELGLNIEQCSVELYALLRKLHSSYANQMELQKRFDINELILLAENSQISHYHFVRAMIESCKNGAHHFVTEGVMEPIPNNGEVIPQETPIRDRRIFEGWRKIL